MTERQMTAYRYPSARAMDTMHQRFHRRIENRFSTILSLNK